MTAEAGVKSRAAATRAGVTSTVATEGVLVGLAGGATIALWFFVLDILAGRPLYTPNVLGTAVFRGTEALAAPEALPISLEMVVGFTWVHLLHFMLIGVAVAQLVTLAERNASLGFGILLLFIVFEFGFVGACMLFAEPVLRALAWPAVLVGNLLAAGTVGVVLWRRHPHLRILP
jgi:hypothetical protein